MGRWANKKTRPEKLTPEYEPIASIRQRVVEYMIELDRVPRPSPSRRKQLKELIAAERRKYQPQGGSLSLKD